MILDKILQDKKLEVERLHIDTPPEYLLDVALQLDPPLDFKAAISGRPAAVGGLRSAVSDIRLIAEVKKASPSKGLIRPDFDPVAIARRYEETGASAISVLTDEKYFQGKLEYLTQIHQAVGIPLLRKDFIIDPMQVYEARAAGADSVLLIAAALSLGHMHELLEVVRGLGMAALVEVHTESELCTALSVGADIIGINNRDLQTFETRLETTLELASRVPPDKVLVSESGINTRADVERLMQAGVDAILVGESLMREPDPGTKVLELLSSDKSDRSDHA